ncbi:alpha/beta hydrolase fold domain-containing protein [Bifidobacterium asteroides]|nr:alpha/beta hydrolase fold domain-containing protein [Bifidobacterium asteroides]MCP8615092.1 alpha/beta hydrolase [Bifidobacterium asteroides]
MANNDHDDEGFLRKGDPYDLLHPFFKERLHLVRGQKTSPVLPDDFMKPAGHWTKPDNVLTFDQKIYGPYGEIPIRVYCLQNGTNSSWLMWMHGGGFIGGSIDQPEADAVCAELTSGTGVICVSPAYRLASCNGNHFPVALKEIMAVWEWIQHHASRNENCRFFVGGASAGANLAAGLCVALSERKIRRPDGLLSAYGVFHGPEKPVIQGWESKTQILPEPLRLSRKRFKQMYINYLGSLDKLSQKAMPGQGDVSCFPHTGLVISEFDNLAPSSVLLARQLKSAHVPVETYFAVGMLHGFFNWYPVARLEPSVQALNFFSELIEQWQHSRSRE